jgi:hypothetical protein
MAGSLIAECVLRDGGMDLSLISVKKKRFAVKRVPRFL